MTGPYVSYLHGLRIWRPKLAGGKEEVNGCSLSLCSGFPGIGIFRRRIISVDPPYEPCCTPRADGLTNANEASETEKVH